MTIDPGVIIAAIGVLASAVGAFARLIYVDLKRDRDFWRDAYVAATHRTDSAIEVAATVATKVPKRG